MPIRTEKEIRSDIPVLIAGWPGMGNVGFGAAAYLRKKLKGSLCARIDVTRYFFPEAVDVENGIGRIPSPPDHNIYLIEDPPVLIFEGESQAGGEAGMAIADELLDFAQRHGVRTVYTGAAFAVPMSFRDSVEVFGVATGDRLKGSFASYGVKPLAQGRISGLNGLLLGLAGSRNLSAACFLATMPQYAVHTPNPKSSKAIVRVFERILNTAVDMTGIDRSIAEVDKLLGEFESRVNAALQAMRQGSQQDIRAGEGAAEDGEQPGPHEVEPHEAMDRIESLFELVQHDRSKAGLLKQQLDRWGLFELYEDRFLDLFDKKRNQRDE